MNKFRNYSRLLAIVLIGFFIFSCNEDPLTSDLSENQVSETNVSPDLAKRVALNFTKDESFIGKPTKDFLSYRNSYATKSTVPLSSFEEKDIDNIIWIFEKTDRRDGHAWVCDGLKETVYASSGKFLHMNWGWNGSAMGSNNNNGWFKYNDFKIDGFVINGTSADFQYKNRMIIGIKPN